MSSGEPKNPVKVAAGRKGGASRSPQKLTSVRRNLVKAMQARYPLSPRWLDLESL